MLHTIRAVRPFSSALLVIILVCFGLALPKTAQASGFNPLLETMLQSALAQAVSEYAIPGAVMAVKDPEGNVAYFTTGLANTATNAPMTTDLHFHIGSLTKTYVATAVLMLVDQGILNLDDTLEKWLPGKVSRGSEITLRNLLQMRSGLGHYETNDEFAALHYAPLLGGPKHEFTMDELIGWCNTNFHNPGERYDYNNINYMLLGWVMEAATGEDWEQLIYRLIINPLGLSYTSVPTTSDMPQPSAHGYLNPALIMDDTATATWQSLDTTTTFGMSAYGAAGCMISTLDDLLTWLEAFLSGRLLSASSRLAQFTMRQSEIDHYWYYGMGVLSNFGLLGHAGNLDGFYTAALYRFNGYDFAILANGQLADANSHASAHYCILRLKWIVGCFPMNP